MQYTPLRRQKMTPLFLLSQVKKSNLFFHNKNYQSAPSFLELQQRKISHRYQEILNKRSQLHQSVREMQGEREENDKRQTQNKTAMSKIEQLLRKTSKKVRYNSVHKTANIKKAEHSPYLGNDRRRSQSDGQKINVSRIDQNITSMLKARLKSKINLQLSLNNPTSQTFQSQHKMSPNAQNINRIFIHYSNIFKISQILDTKKKQKQIIACIKIFVLEEEGDPSSLQYIYANEKVCQEIKRVLFLEKVLIILIVDLIINIKYRLVENIVKSAMKIIMRFYAIAYKDLKNSNNVKKQDIEYLDPEALNKLNESQKQSQSSYPSFNHIYNCLFLKLKTCFKYSKSLEDYYKTNHTYISTFSSNLSYFRLLQYYSHFLLGSNWTGWNIDFLETCPSPYLHFESKKKYTLVLDLDQTLIHYKVNNNNLQGEFLIRPYMFEFLQEMSEHFEIGIFTCSMPQYADIIINHMKNIQFRLYRHHTVKIKGQYIKDLSRIGRDLRYLILVDNLEQNYRLQKENGIHIRSWYGDRNDEMLKKLSSQLMKLVKMNVDDFRNALFQRKFL